MKSFEETLVAAAVAGWTITIEPRPDGIAMVAAKGDREYGIMYGNPEADVSGTAFRMQHGFCRWFDGIEKEQDTTKK